MTISIRPLEGWVLGLRSPEELSGCPVPSKDQRRVFHKFFIGPQHNEKNKVKAAEFS